MRAKGEGEGEGEGEGVHDRSANRSCVLVMLTFCLGVCNVWKVVENKFRREFGEQRGFVTSAQDLGRNTEEDAAKAGSDDDEWQPELLE